MRIRTKGEALQRAVRMLKINEGKNLVDDNDWGNLSQSLQQNWETLADNYEVLLERVTYQEPDDSSPESESCPMMGCDGIMVGGVVCSVCDFRKGERSDG